MQVQGQLGGQREEFVFRRRTVNFRNNKSIRVEHHEGKESSNFTVWAMSEREKESESESESE